MQTKRKSGGLFGLIITGLLVSFLFSAIRHHLPPPKFPAQVGAGAVIEEAEQPSKPDEPWTISSQVVTRGRCASQERYSTASDRCEAQVYYRDSYLLEQH